MQNGEKLEIKDIPIMPQVATKILQMQENNLEISFKELESIILLDPALTAKILKVSNSALYARQREITNLQQAITLLGFKMIKSLVLLVCASNLYGKPGGKNSGTKNTSKSKSSPDLMWQHLILTAFVAKHIAVNLGMDDKKEDLFIAGLLHDIGRIVFMINAPDRYDQFLERISGGGDLNIIALEEEIFGLHHGEAGKIAFQKWNFPDEFIDAISLHHNILVDSPYKKTVEIVGIANLYARLINNEPLSKHDIEMKEAFTKSLSIDDSVEEYMTTQFINDIRNNELYTMSTALI